jgi:hypothetical protein
VAKQHYAETRHRRDASITAAGVLSARIALALPQEAGLAGFVYFLIAVQSVVAGALVRRRRRREVRQT